MKKAFLALLVISFLLVVGESTAQKVSKQGYIKYEITDVKSDDAQAEAMSSMLKGTVQKVFFNEKFHKMTIDMMNGSMKMMTIFDLQTNNMTMFNDIMGRKIKINMNEDQIQEMNKNTPKDFKVILDKKDRKKISGYDCYKATLSTEIPSPGAQESTTPQKLEIVTYITEEFKAPRSVIQNLDAANLDGLPLEYILDAGGMFQMTYTATEISKEVNKKEFKDPEEEYQEMTYEEFMKSFGQMGGAF